MVRTYQPSRGSGQRPFSAGHETANKLSLCTCSYEVGTEGNKTTKHLPQVDVTAHARIFSTASETELEQTFVNPSKRDDIAECITSFHCMMELVLWPLPAKLALA